MAVPDLLVLVACMTDLCISRTLRIGTYQSVPDMFQISVIRCNFEVFSHGVIGC